MYRIRKACLAIQRLLVVGLLGCVVLTGQPSAAAERIPKSRTYLGAYIQPDDWSRAGQKSSVTTLESDIGRKLNIDHLFYAWDGNAFPGWRQRWDRRKGRIPMISWAGTHLSQILDGSNDGLIRERADALRGLRGRVLLRWFGEMDAGINDDEIESPAQFVDAWRYMHDVFVDRGAVNVKWVWCPNASAFDSGEAAGLYPGDAYVDWICADGYNWAPMRPNADWTSFRSIFSSFYAWAAPKSQPLMIGETGVMENETGDKAAWIRGMGDTIKDVYPDIKALVYFDAYATANFGGWYDWRLDTSDSSYQAFESLARRPLFNPR